VLITSSSAVAKRSRDASCLWVVSFNSTIRRAQFFIISYFGFTFTSAYTIRFCSVVFGVTSSPCCHTHDSRTIVTVYSTRSRLVGLALYTVTDNRDWPCPIPAVNKNPATKCHNLTTVQQLPIAKLYIRWESRF